VNSLEPLLLSLWKDLHDARVLWQLAVIAVSVAIAWWVSRLLLPRLIDPGVKWQYGAGGLRSVRFPLIALVLVLLGRWVLAHYQNVSLLKLAVPLLMALAIIRIVIYMLHLVFTEGAAVSTTGRVISWVVWLGFAIYITGYAPDLIDFLDETGFRLGKQHLSLLIVLQTMLSIVIALLISLWLGHLFEGRVMDAHGIDINLRVMLAKLMRPLLVLIAMPMVGIDLTALSVFGGAIGVGIGFGLQKTASNYISGFIILLDRSVNIGDLVTIEKHTGQLTKMTARYVVLRDTDGTEVIIPNETVITSTVINHSYSDKTVRVPIALQISYRSDLDVAMRVLVDAALAHPRVLKVPAPKVLIRAFADNGIELELGVWVNDPEEGRANLRSDIYCTVWREFQAKGIEIPYPQREVRVLGTVSGTPHD
jgi:small-conductance mechanosensitive channel